MTNDLLLAAGGTAAAVLVVAWPKVKAVIGRIPAFTKAVTPASAGVTFQDAIAALVAVKGRLGATGGVSEPAAKAIEVLTLALVEGSER